MGTSQSNPVYVYQEKRERRMLSKGVKKRILIVMFSQQYLNVR